MQQKQYASPLEAENGKQFTAVITLIHGTFAPDAAWTKDSSPLCEALANSLNGKIRIERFPWSGGNRFKDRDDAAEQLASFISRLRSQHEGIPLLIVGHSHGGSVLAYLLKRHPDVAKTIAGAAFLATPFIDARARPDHPFVALVTAIAMILSLLALITSLALFAMITADAAGYRYLGALFLCIWMVTYFSAVIVVVLLSRRSVPFPRSDMSRLADALSSSHLPPGRYLFMRCTGDEAASALGLAQFSSWLMSLLISSMVRPLSNFRIARSRNITNFFLVFMTALVPWGGIIPVVVSFDRYSGAVGSVSLGWWTTEIIAALAALGWWVGSMAACGIILFLMAAVFSVLWVLCCLVCWLGHLSFGRFAFTTALLVDLAVDAVPIGRHELVRLSWSGVRAYGLFHSSPYESGLAVATIIDWARSVLRDSASMI